jgi:hypothetical protein
MIPKREQVLAHARELFFQQSYRSGIQNVNTPEDSELLEGGFYQQAVSELMTSVERKNERWLKESESAETSAFTVDIDTLFKSNALILGSRGIGKSDLAMMICDKANAIVIVFDPSLDWSARSSIPRVMKVEPYRNLDVPCESTIFDISLLSPNEQARIVENFAKNLFDYQVQASNRKQYLVIFEESHTYFYQGCMRSKNLANCVRLLSVGRNVSTSCVLISQFASMLDKFAIKHSTSQMWCGFTREPNDLMYLKQILGSDVKELSKLKDGEFLYLTRNGLSKINISPYESVIQKQEIAIPQCTPIEPIKPKQETNIVPFLRLGVIICFTVLLLGAMR